MRFAREFRQFFNALSGGGPGGRSPPGGHHARGWLRCKGGAHAVLGAKKSKILKSPKSVRNGWKWVGEGPGVLENAICAHASSSFQRPEREGGYRGMCAEVSYFSPLLRASRMRAELSPRVALPLRVARHSTL